MKSRASGGTVRLAVVVLVGSCQGLLASPGAAAGQKPAEGERAEPEQQLVISARRIAVDPFSAIGSVEVLEPEQIAERQAVSLPELVEEVPGVFLQQTNRGAGSPFIRGLVGPQNLILVDGVRFSTSTHRTGPNQYLALLDPFGLQRLEILRGPSSVRYGNGAMGGVIQAMTSSPVVSRGAWRAGGQGRGLIDTADRTPAGAFRVWTSGEGVALAAGLNVSSFGPLRAGGGAFQPASDYLASYWNAKLIYAPEPDWSMTAAYLGAGLRDAGRTDALGSGDLRFYDNTDHLVYLVLQHRGGDLFRRMRLAVSYQRLDEHVDRYSCLTSDAGRLVDRTACLELDPAGLTRVRRYDDGVDVLGAEGSLGLDLWAGRLRLTAGVELYQDLVSSRLEEARSEDGFRFSSPARGNFTDGSGYTDLGVYLHGEVDLWIFSSGAGLLRASGGLRYSYFGAKAAEVPGLGDVDFGIDGVVGSLGLAVILPDWLNVYASFVQGFRAPNLQETTVLGDTGDRFEVPNPDLGPELAHTLELGTRLALAWIEVGAAFHYAFLDDMITQQPTTHEGRATVDGKPVTRLVNADSGAIQGADLKLRLFHRSWQVFAQVSWTEGQVTTERGTSPARRIPPLFGLAGLRYTDAQRGWFVQAYTRFALRQDRLHPSDARDPRICETAPASGQLRDPCDGTPGWWTLNLRAAYRLDDRFRLDAALTNLADVNYRLHGSGLDAPGIGLRVSITAGF